MMVEMPVIVISSPQFKTGKTTVVLNLASALWNDGYEVKIFSHNDKLIEQFIEKRKILNEKGHDLYIPEIIDENTLLNASYIDKGVIIADIPSLESEQYKQIFYKAHTLITVIKSVDDLIGTENIKYLELIWEVKKVIAQKGIKNLNWITVENMMEKIPETEIQNTLHQHAKRYGYRIFSGLKKREAFKCINEGLCLADKVKTEKKSMTMHDLYACREILRLTDFLWNYK
jgi:hypothetical protein